MIDEFQNELKKIQEIEEMNKLILYKNDTCVICTNQSDTFINSQCCNNSYACIECMIKFQKCLICKKDININLLYKFVNMQYEKTKKERNERMNIPADVQMIYPPPTIPIGSILQFNGEHWINNNVPTPLYVESVSVRQNNHTIMYYNHN